MEENQTVKIIYTNYRNETAIRQIIPIRIWFGKTEWHPEPQWVLDAFDLDKEAERSFSMREIKAWGV